MMSLFVPSVYAQTTTPRTTAQVIVADAQRDCTDATTASILPENCVSLLYESGSTIVLNGEALLTFPGASSIGIPNPSIWQAVDQFKIQGYQIDSIAVGGVGSVGNPNEFYIVMSK